MKDKDEIKKTLNDNVEKVCQYLLPNGKINSGDWEVGSIGGEAGQSLKVGLRGNGTGLWNDLADTNSKGDLISLWMKVKSVRFPEAMKQIREFFCISPQYSFGKKKDYARPKRSYSIIPVKKESDVFNYLINERKISKDTLDQYKVSEKKDFIVFPYFRENELINRSYIGLKRDEKNKKKMYQEKNAEPCLFGWQAISDNRDEIIITEGQIDAMSFYEYGYVALSIPSGVNQLGWIENDWDYLQSYETVYLAMDMDEAGEKAIKAIVERIGRHKCKVICLPNKDANDCLKAGVDKHVIDTCVFEAKSFEPEELKSNTDYFNEVLKEFYCDDEDVIGTAFPFGKPENIRFIYGDLNVWSGFNGHGKTSFMSQVLIELMKQSQKVCIASFEMKPAKTLKKIYQQALGYGVPSEESLEYANNWFMDRMWIYSVLGTAKKSKMMEAFHYARYRFGVTHFVVDSLMKCGFREDDYDGQKAFAEELDDFAMENNCVVHLVAHVRKPEGVDGEYKIPSKYQVKGSGGITDVAANCFTVWRNKLKEQKVEKGEMCDEPDVYFRCDKNREIGWEGSIALWHDNDSSQYREMSTSHAKRLI